VAETYTHVPRIEGGEVVAGAGFWGSPWTARTSTGPTASDIRTIRRGRAFLVMLNSPW
jgi:hypothetical protein